MHDRPTADELTEAVSQFLQSELAPALSDPRLRFRTLIAANLMAIVTRELRAGDAPLRAEWAKLAALVGHAEAPPIDAAELRAGIDTLGHTLCARIRAGHADEGPWAEQALAYAEQAVIAKLQIANPRFLERIG